MRCAVADIVVKTLASLPLMFPEPDLEDRKVMEKIRVELEAKHKY